MAKAKKTVLSLDEYQLFTLEVLVSSAVFENKEIIKKGPSDSAEHADHRLDRLKTLQEVIDKAKGFDKSKQFTLD